MRDPVRRRITCAELCFFCWILSGIFSRFSVFALAVHRDNQLESSHFEPNLPRTGKYKDELRCHCNLPLCVTTGYMCKSSVGMCFSEIVDARDPSKSRHGCVEPLGSKRSTACLSQTESADSSLVCCEQDLCNFDAEQARVRAFHHPAFRNRSESNGIFEFNPSELNSISGSIPSHVASRDLWLKAATIAVPIAGGFILILLVLLAIRILKRDRRAGRAAGYYGGHWNSGSDFQIRRVWGKARQGAVQPEQQRCANLLWRDVQPMLSKNNAQPPRIMKLTMTGNTVYLPTTVPAKSSWWKDSGRVRPIHEV